MSCLQHIAVKGRPSLYCGFSQLMLTPPNLSNEEQRKYYHHSKKYQPDYTENLVPVRTTASPMHKISLMSGAIVFRTVFRLNSLQSTESLSLHSVQSRLCLLCDLLRWG